MANYRIGTDDPTLKPDPGAGAWNSVPKQLKYRLLGAEIVNHLPHAAAVVGIDAAKNMLHYFGNTGADLTIDLAKMLQDVPAAQDAFNTEYWAARKFVESLPPGIHAITSEKVTHGYNAKADGVNWYFAIGGYSVWGKGTADVASVGGAASYLLDFEFKFFDRYNWDAGKSVTLFGVTITDSFMGEFHRQGLAREFNCVGSLKSRHAWGAARPAPAATPAPAPGVRPPAPPVPTKLAT